MKYFKNTELAKLYHVSEKSVRNWIDAAEQGKIDLQLYEFNTKKYITNTSKNITLVEELVNKGKKYKNKRGYKVVTPSEQFYEIYGSAQVYDIISNIEIHREIPHAYSYFNGGARHWDLYTRKLLDEKAPNPLTKTIDLLELNANYIDDLIREYDVINVIDLGVGNCLPVKNLLERLLGSGKLKRYMGIDTSQDMLAIAEQNITKWFGGRIKFEGHVRDIVYDRFSDLLADDSIGGANAPTVNLVLFFGATILNFREPEHALQTINNSMGKNDLLLFSLKLDTERARRYFDFSAESEGPVLDLIEKAILDFLNIEPSFYDVEQFFDSEKMARQIQVRLKVALSIEFQLGQDGKKVVELNKGETILLWRAKHQSAIETINQLDRNGFDLIQATRSKDQEYLLSISKIKVN